MLACLVPGRAGPPVYRPAGGAQPDLHRGDPDGVRSCLTCWGASYLVDVAILYGLLNLLAVAVLSRISSAATGRRRGRSHDSADFGQCAFWPLACWWW